MDSRRSPSVSIPRLRTARLELREYRVQDFDAFAAHILEEGTSDRKDAWRIFGCNTGGWLLQGAGWWSVEARDTADVVGTVGAFFREGWPEIEIGWNTYRAFRGRGFASEAAAEVVRYAFETRGERCVTALVHAGNAASLGVAARIGMRHEADVELWGRQVGRYVRER